MIDGTLTIRDLREALDYYIKHGVAGEDTPVFCSFPGSDELCRIEDSRIREVKHPGVRAASHPDALVLQGAPSDFYV